MSALCPFADMVDVTDTAGSLTFFNCTLGPFCIKLKVTVTAIRIIAVNMAFCG